MKKGFTLLELIVVIIVIGVLATLGFTQYVKVVEKGRTAEARMILGSIRSAEEAYRLEYGKYAPNLADLPIEAPDSCKATHFYSYKVDSGTTDAFVTSASRCTASGKEPQAKSPGYKIILDQTGKWGGDAGYY